MASPKCSTDGCVYLPPELCSTPLLSPIHPNSTLSQVVSPCLAKTTLPAFPVLVSFLAVCWLSLQPALFPGSCQSSQQLPFTKLAISKLILSLLAVLLGIMDFTLTLALPSFLGPSPTLPEQYNEPLFGLAFSLSALLAYGQCIRLGFVTSGLLHLASVFRLLSLLPDLALALLDSPHPFLAVPSNFLLLLHLLVALGISGLLCAADTLSGPQQYEQLDAHGKQVCPNKRVSAISSAIYWYVSGLVWHGLRGSLSFDHIWAMNKEDQAEFLRERFYGTAKQRKQAESEPKKLMTLFSLFWRIFRSIWEPTCTAIALAILIVLGRYANAAFLRLIVDSVNSQKPLWLTLTTLVGLFAVDLVSKVITTRRDLHSQRAFQNSRASITTAIFDKMLKLSAAGRAKYSAGEVLNLLTTDVLRVRYFFWLLRDFVYCPFMILIALFGLFMEIGWNTMFGVGILLSVLPINYWLSKVQSRLEEKQMKIKDARLKLVNDALSGMKVLKLYAWEESMQRRIFEQRRREMYALRKIFLLDAAISLSFQLAPLLATIVSFYGYTILQGNPMRPDVAFVSLLFFAMLRFSIYQLPQLLTYTIRARVSGKRILDLLNEQEQQPSHIVRDFDPSNIDHSPVVLLRNCSFSWAAISGQANPTLHLRNINLTMPAGELIGIVGRVGSGKSSLLAAILGEMSRLEGEEGSEALVRARTIGYVPQQPWIQNRTLRSNVLFDLPMDENRYAAVLSACALETDMKLLAAGDLTEIGEKGINLSGGQKSRVALARAVYQDADLYVLDDTLSAVDAHVGAHIFDKVISQKGLLAKKTRLWALNTLAFLRHCDRLVVMDGGEINSIGTLEELKQQKEGPFADLIREFMQKQLERQRSARSGGVIEGDGVGSVPADNELAEVLDQLQLTGSPLSNSLLEQRQKFEQQQSASEAETVPSPSSPPNPSPAVQNGTATASTTILRCRRRSHSQCSHDHEFGAILSEQSTTTVFHSQLQLQQAPAGGDTANELIGRLTDEEELATGMVSRRVYLDYMRAFGLWLSFFFFFFLFMGNSAAEGLSSVWLAQWSNQNSTAKSTFYLSIYGAFNMASVVCTAITGIIIALGAYYASTAFHDRLLRSLFRSPMAFYERTPLGRILNRLSNDIDRIDENIPWAVSSAMIIFAEALNSLIAICIVIPSLMLVVFPLLAIFLVIVHLYNLASVQLRRLSSKSWSSTCSFVQDAHLGSDSIRVLNVQERFRDRCCRLTDFTNETSSAEIYTNRWLQVRLDIISDLAVFICVLVAVLMAYNGYVTLGTLAMVIGSGYTFTGYLGEVARVWRESEVQMVCIERVGEYIRNEHEPAWRLPRLCGPNWPSAGQIQFVDFCLRYRPDLELVLKNLSFEVKPGEKVGIVGRTGAGKSSLTLALFRILEPASGKILIDGVDIGTLGLHDLRSALTIIPQDPVLFCGTLRTNLDPFDEYTDSGIWDALEKAHLKETVSGWEDGLAHEVAEGGSNLSVGQRQLVCLARALLRQRTRILVLDEATASIDADTDARIQESIRKHFKHCTLLTIAHRLNTILDYDRILVMDAGQVAEFDSPSALLTRPQSLFFQLAKQAGVGLNRE